MFTLFLLSIPCHLLSDMYKARDSIMPVPQIRVPALAYSIITMDDCEHVRQSCKEGVPASLWISACTVAEG